MARTHARILTSIWSDDDFRALATGPQRTYLTVVSQPELSICGVLDYNAKRLARLAPDSTPLKVARDISILQQTRFVVVDDETDELAVRTFMRHDGVIDMPNPLKAAARAWSSIHSQTIRRVVTDQLPFAIRELWPERILRMDAKAIGELLRQPQQEPLPGTLPPNGSANLLVPGPGPSPGPRPPEPAVTPSNGSPPAADDRDDDLEKTCTLIAQRKLALKVDRGDEPPHQPAAWIRTTRDHDIERLAARHRLLRSQHPDWPTEKIADHLDPETAEHDPRNPVMTVEESQAWLADQAARQAQAETNRPDPETFVARVAETRQKIRDGIAANRHTTTRET